MDLKRDARGEVERMPPDQRAFGRILLRTFEISAIVTLWCLALGYPLAYWLSTLPARSANVLMILVLVPFWTSIVAASPIRRLSESKASTSCLTPAWEGNSTAAPCGVV